MKRERNSCVNAILSFRYENWLDLDASAFSHVKLQIIAPEFAKKPAALSKAHSIHTSENTSMYVLGVVEGWYGISIVLCMSI